MQRCGNGKKPLATAKNNHLQPGRKAAYNKDDNDASPVQEGLSVKHHITLEDLHAFLQSEGKIPAHTCWAYWHRVETEAKYVDFAGGTNRLQNI